ETLCGKDAEEVFGPELFGPDGTLRRALAAGGGGGGGGGGLRVAGGGPRQGSRPPGAPPGGPGGRWGPRGRAVGGLRAGGGGGGREGEERGDGAPTLFAGLIARSPGMLRIFRLIGHLEESEARVLLTGESGTGKELVARALPLHSPRRLGAFVAVNCGAIPGE